MPDLHPLSVVADLDLSVDGEEVSIDAEGDVIVVQVPSARAPHFGAIRDHLGAPDTALLPIGAYTPRWLMAPIHVDPGEAWQAFRDLEAGSFIPIHWGTFDLAGEPVQEPPERLRQCAREDGMTDRLHVLDLGASVQPAPAAPAGKRERA